jgi:hypothetical protein
MVFDFNNELDTKKSFLILSVIGAIALCYYRTLKTCLLTRISHCEVGCIKIDSVPVKDEFIHDILEDEEEKFK